MAATASVPDSLGLVPRTQEGRVAPGEQTRWDGAGKESLVMVDGFVFDSVNYRPTVKYEALCTAAPPLNEGTSVLRELRLEQRVRPGSTSRLDDVYLAA